MKSAKSFKESICNVCDYVNDISYAVGTFLLPIMKGLLWAAVIAVLAWVLWFIGKGIFGFLNYYGKFA